MDAHRRPDRDITPDEFFEQWLPAEIERLGAGGIADVLVVIELEGEGGGAWELQTRGGQLYVSPPDPARSPPVRLKMSVQDWRAIVAGEPGPVSLTPPRASPTDLLFVDGTAQQLLTQISGTFRFEVRDYNARTWSLTAIFGAGKPAEPPTALISTDAETYSKMLARELAAPEAYFTGRITISGNAGLGMQVGLALLPKL